MKYLYLSQTNGLRKHVKIKISYPALEISGWKANLFVGVDRFLMYLLKNALSTSDVPLVTSASLATQ